MSLSQPSFPDPRALHAPRPVEAGLLGGRCVLEVCRVPFLGGAERIALDCARAVRAAGGRAIVAGPSSGGLEAACLAEELEIRDIRPLSGRRSLASDLARGLLATARNTRTLEGLVRREAVDLIHAHHPIGALQAGRAAARTKTPLLLHVHETLPVPRQYAALAGWLRRRCDAFICVSEAGREMMRSLGAPEDRIHLLYNAVAPHFFDAPRPAALGPGPHIGIFGVLEPRKGHADLIAAFGRLAIEQRTAQLWIVGELSYAENAGYVAELKALAADWDVLPQVRFTGYRRDVAELVAAMDVVALPSHGFESLPTVLLEAAALGRVCVATDVGGVREIIQDGVTGFVVKPNDPAGLAEALQRALSPAAARLGRAARAHAETRFSPARFERDLSALLSELLRERGAAVG